MKLVMCTQYGRLGDADPAKRGVLEIRDVPEPVCGEEDIKIKVAYCGICGSDPHTIEGFFERPLPLGMGHEVSGVVVEVGQGATANGFKVGDRVAGNFRYTCGKCYACTNNMEQYCRNGGPSRPCMGEYVVWGEKQAIKLPDDVSLLQGALLEPVSVAVRAADKCVIKPGQNVLVSGGGPIGLLTAQMINMYGAANLTVLEPNPARRELALKNGAKYVFNPVTDDVSAAALDITNGRGFDVLFECSGVPSAAESMLGLSAPLANIVYVAQYPKDYKMQVSLHEMFYQKEVIMTGILLSPYTFTRAAQLLSRFKLDEFTEAVFDLDDALEAFDVHMSGKYPKVMVRCNAGLE